MATMNDIDRKTKQYADARTVLVERVGSLHLGIEALKREHMRGIKGAVASARAAESELRELIEESPQLFAKPRSIVLHGIKVGYRKATGKIEIDDEEMVVKLIRKHYPEQFDTLVKTTERPVKKALEQLSAAELKKLGIVVNETGDVVLIKDTTSDVDKLVTALLKEEAEEVAA